MDENLLSAYADLGKYIHALLNSTKIYSYKVSANRGRKVSVDSTETPSPKAEGGLLFHWGFNNPDHKVIRDSSGSSIYGEIVGDVKEIPSLVGKGILLNGVREFVGASINLCEPLQGDSSFAFWFKTKGKGHGGPHAWYAPAVVGST
jgi:hypothetical protein